MGGRRSSSSSRTSQQRRTSASRRSLPSLLVCLFISRPCVQQDHDRLLPAVLSTSELRSPSQFSINIWRRIIGVHTLLSITSFSYRHQYHCLTRHAAWETSACIAYANYADHGVSSRQSFPFNGPFRSSWSDVSISSCNSRNAPETSSRNIKSKMLVQQASNILIVNTSPVRRRHTHAEALPSLCMGQCGRTPLARFACFSARRALGLLVTVRAVLLGHCIRHPSSH